MAEALKRGTQLNRLHKLYLNSECCLCHKCGCVCADSAVLRAGVHSTAVADAV